MTVGTMEGVCAGDLVMGIIGTGVSTGIVSAFNRSGSTELLSDATPLSLP